jgi:NhaA family Na+:H+ antiporter
VAFLVLPLFALANTAILIDTGWYKSFTQPGSIGIMAGLMAGKPAGVLLFSFIAIISGICVLPEGLKWKHVIGIALLAGIGFTMSIFISLLAYNDPLMITQSKIAILTASVISGVMGFFWLRYSLKDN